MRLSANTLNTELKLWSSNHQQQHQSHLIKADNQSWPDTTPSTGFHSSQQFRPLCDGAALIMNMKKFKFLHMISCQFTFVTLHLSITKIKIHLWFCVSIDRNNSYLIFIIIIWGLLHFGKNVVFTIRKKSEGEFTWDDFLYIIFSTDSHESDVFRAATINFNWLVVKYSIHY